MSGSVDIALRESGCEIAVVGTGPSGLVAALALGKVGASVIALGPAPQNPISASVETRTAALLASSIDLLKRLELWDGLKSEAAPLKAIRIIDASGSLLRAPDLEFRASELGLEAFGYNIANSALIEVLYAKAASTVPALQPANVARIELLQTRAVLSGDGGWRIAARLVVGAD